MKIQLVAVLSVVLALAVWLGILWHVQGNTLTTHQLCVVLSRVITSSDERLGSPGTAGYSYYKVHPDELRAAHKATAQIIKDLPCQPK